jgi:hypothetical protein
MNLLTLAYLPEPETEQLDPTIGLLDLRKGLYTIVSGYLLCLFATLAAIGVAAYVILGLREQGVSAKTVESASTILFATVLIFYVLLIGSVILIVKGKWMCLLSAPEQCHAKWMMFMAILLILTGPALNRGASYLMSDADAAPRKAQKKSTADDLVRSVEDLKDMTPKLDARGYVRLVGNAASLLSSVFFVLFLRALALCWNSQTLARFTELFLLLMGVLIVGVVMLVWKPAYMIARPHLLLGLAGGWLVCGLWYFGLILGSIGCIGNALNQRRFRSV